jgi:hypothetical protein
MRGWSSRSDEVETDGLSQTGIDAHAKRDQPGRPRAGRP